jgi:hypothetical protein
MWPDSEVFILGGGPGLNLVDIDKLKGRRVIAVNNAYQLAPWFDVMFFGDCRWYNWHKKGLREFAGLKVTACEGYGNGKNPELKAMRRRNSPRGISSDRTILSWNLNSGACAINLAVHFGAKRIVLLGFDMRKINGSCNWHEDHETSNRPNHNPYARFLVPFPDIARDLKNMGIECVNATPDSALTHFPIVSIEEVCR